MRKVVAWGALLILGLLIFLISKPQGSLNLQKKEGNLLPPDLKLSPPSQLYIESSDRGKFILFNTTFINQGKGYLEIEGKTDQAQNSTKAIQKILKKDGGIEEHELGKFIFHSGHRHWHIEKYSVFELWSLKENREKDKLLASTEKLSFCLWDEYEYDLNLENAPKERKYLGDCNNQIQGISVGWSDTYEADIEGQELNISSIPDGSYLIRSVINPDKKILESDYNNNEVTLFVKIEDGSIFIL